MRAALATGSFRVVEATGTGARRLELDGDAGAVVAIAGYAGDVLPARLEAAVLERDGRPGHWRLTGRGLNACFEARSVELLEPRPTLFESLLAPHRLRARDRRMIRLLLGMLRLPGGAWLLRTWQARRR
jgi:hypothetical protein